MPQITIGAVAGHHFNGQADLTVARHATDGKRRGFFMTRKWLDNRKAFNYDAKLGWAKEHWFDWGDE